MPTFTAVGLDRLLESGESKSVNKSGYYSKPPLSPSSKLRRRNSASLTERKVNPALLYATQEAIPLPDLPPFFPTSPYIVNHKRRGPRLSRTSSEVVFPKRSFEEDEVSAKPTNSIDLSKDAPVIFSVHEPNEEKHQNAPVIFSVHEPNEEKHHNGVDNRDGEFGSCINSDGFPKDGEFGNSDGFPKDGEFGNSDGDVPKVGPLNSERYGDGEDFFDLNESTNVTSNTEGYDHTVPATATRSATSGVEFYDACDELSSDNTPQSELREIRSSLLVEIEKRKQAEEDLNKMRCKWKRISQELAVVGMSLPADPVATEDELVKPAEELRQQECVARFVSLSVGRGIARAEMEMEMESQIESKNFEIARLWDRLNYYEAVNREMSQRNQEAIEIARRDRKRKKRRQRWVWGSIATAITLGTAVLAWSYMPTGKGSSAPSASAPDSDDAAAK